MEELTVCEERDEGACSAAQVLGRRLHRTHSVQRHAAVQTEAEEKGDERDVHLTKEKSTIHAKPHTTEAQCWQTWGVVGSTLQSSRCSVPTAMNEYTLMTIMRGLPGPCAGSDFACSRALKQLALS